jgi:hypothetical protein
MGGMNLTQIWSGRDDFEQCAEMAMALTKPEREPAPVISIETRERL